MLYTNDPQKPSITLKLVARANPVPAFVKLIANAVINFGGEVEGFHVWPTAQPVVVLPAGERANISLRIRPTANSDRELKLVSDDPAYKLRREEKGKGYWLDIEVGPIKEPGSHSRTIALTDGANNVSLRLRVDVPAEDIVTIPRELDLGEVSLRDLKGGARKTGRVGVRRTAGQFTLKSVSSSLPFLKLETQVIVEGSNYVVRIAVNHDALPRVGSYTGTVRIETGDSARAPIEVPIKLVVKE